MAQPSIPSLLARVPQVAERTGRSADVPIGAGAGAAPLPGAVAPRSTDVPGALLVAGLSSCTRPDGWLLLRRIPLHRSWWRRHPNPSGLALHQTALSDRQLLTFVLR